ncbi:hypothetical protein D3C80_1511650 [compost metagenome]
MCIFGSRTRETETDHDILRFRSQYIFYDRGSDLLLFTVYIWRYIFSFHVTESLVDLLDRCTRIKITRHDDTHVVWYIICREIVSDRAQGWIFQVFNSTDGRLLTIVIVRE